MIWHSLRFVGQGKPATLPNTVPRGFFKNHEELYRVALGRLRAPGPIEANKDVL